MTPDPIHVYDKDKASDALFLMTSRKFRHLPVISDDLTISSDSETTTNVVGLLDIARCIYDKLGDLEAKSLEDTTILNAMDALSRRSGGSAPATSTQFGCPDIASLISSTQPPEIGVKENVLSAVAVMKREHSTGILVLDDAGRLVGIFTTKDLVLRVVARGLDPANTSVIRVMVSFIC
jgi:CBS domain-containing protein